MFRGDAKLAHSAVWLDVFVEGRDFCFGGTRNWRIARFRWDVFVEGQDFCFWGDAELAHSAIPLGCVCGRTGLLFLGGRGIGA